MELSIVIPAFDEAHKIARDVEAAGRFLGEAGIRGEVIVADDGSGDGTAEAAERAGEAKRIAGVEVRVLRLEHRGKGHAVRKGMVETRGEYVMFADSGVCVPYGDAIRGLELLRGGVDVANGSRKMRESVIERGQNVYRRVLSGMFRRVVLGYLDLPRELTDTQCGFKMYRGEVGRRIYGQCFTDGFLFDLEVLVRAREQGCRIAEFAVNWACDPDSRLKPSRILWRTLVEMRTIKRLMREEKEKPRMQEDNEPQMGRR